MNVHGAISTLQQHNIPWRNGRERTKDRPCWDYVSPKSYSLALFYSQSFRNYSLAQDSKVEQVMVKLPIHFCYRTKMTPFHSQRGAIFDFMLEKMLILYQTWLDLTKIHRINFYLLFISMRIKSAASFWDTKIILLWTFFFLNINSN